MASETAVAPKRCFAKYYWLNGKCTKPRNDRFRKLLQSVLVYEVYQSDALEFVYYMKPFLNSFEVGCTYFSIFTPVALLQSMESNIAQERFARGIFIGYSFLRRGMPGKNGIPVLARKRIDTRLNALI